MKNLIGKDINMPMLYAGLGLLGAGYDRRVNPWQAAMQGYAAGQQGDRFQAQQAMQERRLGLLERQDQRAEKASQREADAREALQAWQASGADPKELPGILASHGNVELLAKAGPLGQPAAVREWAYYSGLPAEEQQQYLRLKRAAQTIDATRPTGILGTDDTVQPLVTPEAASDAVAEVNEGKARGTATGQAQAALAGADIGLESALEAIRRVRDHPGRALSTGLSRYNPLNQRVGDAALPGSPGADFDSLLATVRGKAFEQAFQSLKGGGQITEFESKTAAQALGDMDTAQSDEAFLRALDVFEKAVIDGFRKIQARSGDGTSGGSVVSWEDL